MSFVSNDAAQIALLHYTPPGARTKGSIWEGCLLLWLIGSSGLGRLMLPLPFHILPPLHVHPPFLRRALLTQLMNRQPI